MTAWFADNITKITDKDAKNNESQVAHYRQVANELFVEKQKQALASSKGNLNIQKNWFDKILHHGSTRDRVSLQYKLLSEDPISRAKYLDSLISMVSPAKKRDCLVAMDVLRRLFLLLLPKSRCLVPFDQRPLLVIDLVQSKKNEAAKSKKSREKEKASKFTRIDETLILWIFEDQLKRQYSTFISNLENVALRDNLEQNKKKAMGVLFELVVNKPELRRRIIKILVNKIGDPSRKLASHAKHKLLLAVNEKHNFVPEFVEEFEAMLYRSNISEKAQYFVMCCLNSMYLRKKNGSSSDGVPLKLVKIYCSFFNAALDKGKIIKRKMLNAILSGINRAFPFLSREEVNENLKQHADSLFRLVHTACHFNQSVQTLMVLFHFMKHQEDLKDRFYQALYRKLSDYRLIRRSGQRQALLLHLIFRALSEDDNLPRLQAFAKRLLTLCVYSADASLVCGVLLMLGELKKVHPDITTTKQMTTLKKVCSDEGVATSDSDEEFFSDIDSDLEEDERLRMRNQRIKTTPKVAPSGPRGYDPGVRDPRHSGADRDCTWELLSLQKFFHPSVRVFAENILNGIPIDYSGDPFEDFTHMHFLDRFLQKKPKRDPRQANATVPGAKDFAINSEEYRKLNSEDIPEDERCFYEFSKAQEERKIRRKKVDTSAEAKETEDEDHESVPDEEFDAYLDKFEGKIDDIPYQDLSDDGSELDLSSGEDGEDDASFTMSDVSSDSDEKVVLDDDSDQEGEDDDELDEDNLYESEDDDDFMEVDDDNEEDNENDENFESDDDAESVDFAEEEETPRQRKQRRWEEQRTADFGSRGKRGRFDRSRSPPRGRRGARGFGGSHRGGDRGRGHSGGYRGERGRGHYGSHQGGGRGRGHSGGHRGRERGRGHSGDHRRGGKGRGHSRGHRGGRARGGNRFRAD